MSARMHPGGGRRITIGGVPPKCIGVPRRSERHSFNGSSASGTSAVAIDNKIEQAMDLVKSHLMFAVREEVEVLKEKISELMDRINQLEYENNILKQNASQEVLTQLQTSGGASQTSTTAAAAAAAVMAAAATAAAATAAAAASASAPPAPASKGSASAATNPSSNGSVS